MDLFEGMTKPRKQVIIDVAPMMDMVFILLIFFIVTSTFTRETGVEVTKPQAQSASEVQRENILVAITREGTLHINERQVDLVTLREVLTRMLSDNPSREVVLVADKASNTGLVVSVLDACNLSGAKKVSISALNRE
jgi:biopolymer transport protein ExbD